MTLAWMVYAAVVSLPVTAGCVLAAGVLRRRSLPERGVWLSGLAVAMALPALRLLPAGAEAAPGNSVPIPLDLGLPATLPLVETGILARVDAVAVAIWALATGALGLRIVHSLLVLRRKSRVWERRSLGNQEVLLSEDVGPAVFGLRRPAIVLPRWALDGDAGRLELVVRHEREHIRAGDPWVVAVILWLRTLLPWHPGVWLLTAGLRQAVELDCDRRVLRRRCDIRAYGEAVLAVASRSAHATAAPLAAFTEPVRFIQRRLLAMTQPRKNLGGTGALTLAALAGLVLFGACETPTPAAEPAVEREVTPPAEAATPASGPAVTYPETPPPFDLAPVLANREEVVAALEANYPPLLRDAGIGGSVGVYVYIDETGAPQDLRIHQSSGHQALDDAALRVAAAVRFTPARKEGAPVAVWVAFPITFAVK